MIREIRTGTDESILDEAFTGGLGSLSFYHPRGTFSLTPASQILLEAIINNKERLNGIGIDWGSGIGCLAILAAKIDAVNKVYGLEISEENIIAAKINAEKNQVKDKVCFLLADSYDPFDAAEKQELGSLRRKVNFIVANPPSSDWDDGFGFRRIVLNGAKDYLIKDEVVLLNISFQYGAERVESLYKNEVGYAYMGVAASTDWVPFDLNRGDLLDCLKIYAQEELNGGFPYAFLGDRSEGDHLIDARTALDHYKKSGISPMTKWQTHMFAYMG